MAVVPTVMKRGSVDFVTARITERTGQDISTADFEVAHVLDSQKADDPSTYSWEPPHASSDSPTPTVRRVKKLVTGTLVGGVKTKYRVFVRVTDSPEASIIDCGTYTVTP